MRSVSGFSLIELMVSMAVGGIVCLGIASVFSFAAIQFQGLIDQNEAEESVLLASFYLRSTLAQAVKIAGSAVDPSTIAGPVGPFGTPDNTTPPFAGLGISIGVAVGWINTAQTCGNATCTDDAGWPGGINTLALFVREHGDPTAVPIVTHYIPTGIFYRPPVGVPPGAGDDISGKIYIAQSLNTGGSFVLTDNNVANSVASGFTFDRIVAFGISNQNAAACPVTTYALGAGGAGGFALKCVNLYLRARYFLGGTRRDYSPDPAAVAAGTKFRDIDFNVSVDFRDNVIGDASIVGNGGNVQRIFNGLYFYRFQSPPMGSF